MGTMTNLKTYSKLVRLETFEDRLNYLKFEGKVGKETFGWDRYLNQLFYRTQEWKRLRNEIIVRDDGCDLGIAGMPIQGRICIHHMNPIDEKDILERTEYLLNPDYLICTSFDTHNAIHYGIDRTVFKGLVERKPGDTCPWRVV